MAAVRSLLYIWKMLILLTVDLFSTMNNVDWKSSLPRFSSHPTHLFTYIIFESFIQLLLTYLKSPLLLKTWQSRLQSQTDNLSFKNLTMQPPWISSTIAQFIFFCFVHVFWFDIKRFWGFCRWEANSQKLIP